MAFCLFLTVFSSFSLVLVMAYDEGYGLLLIFLFQVWYFLLLCNIRSLLDQFKSVPTSQMQDLYNEFKHFKILWIVCWTLQRDLNRLAELYSACWLDWVMPIVCAIHPSFDPLIHWSIDPFAFTFDKKQFTSRIQLLSCNSSIHYRTSTTDEDGYYTPTIASHQRRSL